MKDNIDRDDPGLFEAGYRQGWRERDVLGEPRYPDLAVDRVEALARDARAAAKGDHRPLRQWLADQFDRHNTGLASLGNRFDGLVDVVRLHQTALKNRLDQIAEQIGSVHHTGNPDEVTLTLAGYAAAKQAEFERGRQQGDAERAARAQAEYDRGVADGRASAGAPERAEAFENGRKIGQAEREAELLEQGWTPPGGVHELEVSTGPTDYELWRDALNLAMAWCADGITDETLLGQAEIFRDRLKNYPTISPDESHQAIDDQIAKIDGDETSWGPMPTIDPANTPLDYRPTAEDLF